MNPSFIITNDNTFKLKFTDANSFYSTQYKDFKQEIIDEYNLINKNLQSVATETIDSREVLAPGVVKVTYSNQISFVINYTISDYTEDNLSVKAMGCIMIRGDVIEEII